MEHVTIIGSSPDALQYLLKEFATRLISRRVELTLMTNLEIAVSLLGVLKPDLIIVLESQTGGRKGLNVMSAIHAEYRNRFLIIHIYDECGEQDASVMQRVAAMIDSPFRTEDRINAG